MNISTNHPAIRARAKLVQRERDEMIRADERRVIVDRVLSFIDTHDEIFVGVPAGVLLSILYQIEGKHDYDEFIEKEK